jgi:hypothetical protein
MTMTYSPLADSARVLVVPGGPNLLYALGASSPNADRFMF